MAATISWTDEAGKFQFVQLDSYDEETHGHEAECTKSPAETGGVVTDHVRLGNRVLQLVGFVSNTPLPQNEQGGRYIDTSLNLPSVQVWEQRPTKLDLPEKDLPPNAAGLVRAGFNALFGSEPEALIRYRAAGKTVAGTASIWQLDDPQRVRVSEVWTLLEKAYLARIRVDVATESIGLVSGLIITNLQMPIKAEDGNGAPFSISFEQIRTVSAATVAAPKPLERMGQVRKPAGSKAAKPESEEDRSKRLKSAAATFLDKALSADQGGHHG